MIKQYFLILLILLMVITPVASAFDHCASKIMPDHLPESLDLVISATSSIGYLPSSSHQEHIEKQYHISSTLYCHMKDDCTFHVCGSGYGITPSTMISHLVSSYLFLQFQSLSPYSPTFSPEIRPPIFNL
ncbi:MAG: hypothetical protein KAH20_16630 [Methylococcales bacterium]|nr:hypothetical protein [Methylococcales bacterium]